MKKGILVASFGTTYEETRKKAIESIENLVKEQYGEEVFERAFTSGIIRRKLLKRDNMKVFSPQEGLESLRQRGCDQVVTLSMHVLDGIEYAKLSSEYGKVSAPLLYKEEDYIRIAQDGELNDLEGMDALVFMGHGSEDEVADKTYDTLQKAYHNQGRDNIFIGTVEGEITLEDIIDNMKDKGYKNVLLKPFMIVAGDHAKNDMASDEEDSWKTLLTQAGYGVKISMKGLGEHKVVQEMFMDKLKEAMETK